MSPMRRHDVRTYHAPNFAAFPALCLLLPVPQGALAAASGKTPVQAETSLPLNRTTFHFFSPEDIAANPLTLEEA